MYPQFSGHFTTLMRRAVLSHQQAKTQDELELSSPFLDMVCQITTSCDCMPGDDGNCREDTDREVS